MKYYLSKSFMALTMMAMVASSAEAEEPVNDVSISVNADLVSSYVWRGQKMGGVSLQPGASVSWKGISLGAWGSYALSPTHNGTDEELDITLGYDVKGLHVGVTDYYFFNLGHPFFKYGGLDASAHTFEGNIGYDFGVLSLNWFTNFAGQDGLNKDGDRAYSSYVQVDVPFRLGGVDCTATLGAVPFRTSFYADDMSDGLHINTIALKAAYEVQCKKVTMPLSAQIVANPSSQGLYLVLAAGFSL